MVFALLTIPAWAANDTLQMPSPVRGWAATPDEARTWGQTLLDWGVMIAGIVAISSLIVIYLKSKLAKSSGSITDQNSATKGMVIGIIEIIILIVAIAWIFSIFWK